MKNFDFPILKMKLQNLPKDMLVELVAELQNRKEKEYSEYILTYVDGPDTGALYFKTENELKTWICLYILASCIKPKSFFENEDIWVFLEDMREIPYDGRIEYCKKIIPAVNLTQLIALLRKISDRYIIMRGKCLTENGNIISFRHD